MGKKIKIEGEEVDECDVDQLSRVIELNARAQQIQAKKMKQLAEVIENNAASH